MSKKWVLLKAIPDDLYQQIIPLQDLQPHNKKGVECPCKPKINWELSIVTHNAFDTREYFEPDGLFTNKKDTAM